MMFGYLPKQRVEKTAKNWPAFDLWLVFLCHCDIEHVILDDTEKDMRQGIQEE